MVYDFSQSRAGEHVRNFLQDWKGKLVCDDFGGYKARFELGVTEIGYMAHARRKFFELHATHKSTLAEQALRYIQVLYEIEDEIKDLEPDSRRRIRQEKAVPIMDALHAWMVVQRDIVHSSAVALPSMMGLCPLITIGVRTRYGPGRWGAKTGSLQDHCEVASVRLRS